MPDVNKLAALERAGYKVLATCASCMHFSSLNVSNGWGRCSKIAYRHEKHSAEIMQAGVRHDGTCPDHVRWPHDQDDLDRSGHTRFSNADSA